MHDAWDISRPKGKWREISAEAVGTAVKESQIRGTKAAEKVRREKPHCIKIVEIAVTDENKRKEKEE